MMSDGLMREDEEHTIVTRSMRDEQSNKSKRPNRSGPSAAQASAPSCPGLSAEKYWCRRNHQSAPICRSRVPTQARAARPTENGPCLAWHGHHDHGRRARRLPAIPGRLPPPGPAQVDSDRPSSRAAERSVFQLGRTTAEPSSKHLSSASVRQCRATGPKSRNPDALPPTNYKAQMPADAANGQLDPSGLP